jgi:hypothetical protein
VFGGLDMSNSKAYEEIGEFLKEDEKKAVKRRLQTAKRVAAFEERLTEQGLKRSRFIIPDTPEASEEMNALAKVLVAEFKASRN